MTVLLVVELITLPGLVVCGWGPDFLAWARRRRSPRQVTGVAYGVPFVVPERQAARHHVRVLNQLEVISPEPPSTSRARRTAVDRGERASRSQASTHP